MSLNGRVARLEESAQRSQVSEPCGWHTGVVIYPATQLRGTAGRVILPKCESPATCPGSPRVQAFLPERRTA
jgi:hypothetical protein